MTHQSTLSAFIESKTWPPERNVQIGNHTKLDLNFIKNTILSFCIILRVANEAEMHKDGLKTPLTKVVDIDKNLCSIK